MRKYGKLVTAALTAAMLFQGTVMAAPMDELNEILTSQSELLQESLLSRTLGMEQLKEAIKQNGIDVSWKGGLTEGTAEALMLAGEIPEGAYAELGFEVDLNAENWLLEAGFGAEETALGNLAVYGDVDKLALSVPQLFVGALSLHGGNLKEQYNGSALSDFVASMMEEDISAFIPELNLKFYPEASNLAMVKGVAGSLEEMLIGELQGVEEAVRVEKKDDAGAAIYTMIIPVETVQDVYAGMFELYLTMFGQIGLVETDELYEIEEELETVLDIGFMALPEELSVEFHTKDGLLEKIYYELYLDTGMLAELEQMNGEISYNTQSADENETVFTEVVEGVLDEAGIVTEDMSYDSEEFKGTIIYEIIYTDPSNPAAGIDVHMNMTDDTKGEFADILIQAATVEEGTVSTTTLGTEISVLGQHAYGGTLYTETFDAGTGDLDMVIAIAQDPNSPFAEDMDLEELPIIRLDSTFTEIAPGIGFTWVMDALSVEVDGEVIGITSEVTVSGEPEEIAAPVQERVLLEMTEEEIMGMLMEMMMNAQTWMEQFESDSEIIEEYEEEYYDESVSEEIVLSEEIIGAEADAVSVIGGADGPTSIFVAGKL